MVDHLKLKTCTLVYMLLTSMYYVPGNLTFVIDTAALPVSVGSLHIMYMYFKTRPHVHQTVITGLMKMFLLTVLLLAIRNYVMSIMVNLLNKFTKEMFKGYPTLICSLTNPKWVYIGMLNVLCCLTISKNFLIFKPDRFFNLNHERWTRVSFVLTLAAILTDILIYTGLNGNYCSKENSETLEELLETTVEMSKFKSMPWILILILIVGEVTAFVVQYYRAYKQRLSVAPSRNNKVFVIPTNNNLAPALLPGQEEVNQNSMEKKMSRNISLYICFFHIGLILVISTGVNIVAGDAIQGEKTMMFIKIVLNRFEVYAIPLTWILSSDETRAFAINKLKELLNSIRCPSVIQDYIFSTLGIIG